MTKKIKRRPAIGDVLEIKTPKGLAYAQFTHKAENYGTLIRVLPGLYEHRPGSFTDLVRLKERFYVFFPISAAVKNGNVEIISTEEVPDWARPFPLMRMAGMRDRSGKVLKWWLWDGEQEWPVEALTQEQRSLSLAQIWNENLLVQRLVENWSPATSISDQTAETKQVGENAAAVTDSQAGINNLRSVGSDLSLPHQFEHYLYFPTKTAANKAAQVLQTYSYKVKVSRAADDKGWLTLATHSIIPSIDVVINIRSQLEELASSLKGEYDGWEAAVTYHSPE